MYYRRRDLHLHGVGVAAGRAAGFHRVRRPRAVAIAALARRRLEQQHHLGEGLLHARAVRLQVAVREHPLRLARGREAHLARRE
jgi:hypothetical protein